MSAANTDEAIEPCRVRIRHPIECGPYRPEARPAWSPSHRDRRDAGQPRPVDRPTRHEPRLVAAKGLGAVRINFRYASFQSMAAAHSEKAGRDQYFEGPHETYGFRLHEVGTTWLDLQYQSMLLEWKTLAGVVHSMTFDWAVETEDHSIVLGEDKASDEYFKDPDLAERLDFAEAYLGELGVSLERRIAGGLPNRIQRRVVKNAFDARRTEFDAGSVSRVQNVIRRAGGTAPLGQVWDAIGGHPAYSLAASQAMMHQRVITMPVTVPPMPDTPVTIPPVATKGALRAFLARFAPA